MMPRRRVWARNKSLSRKVFDMRMSWRRAVLLVSSVLRSFCFRMAAMEGRTWAWVISMSDAASLMLVPAWPRGMHTSSTRPL